MRMLSLMAGAAMTVAGTIGPASAQEGDAPADTALSGSITIELNRLEPLDDACRVYFVIGNQTETTLTSLQPDVYVFDPDGVILRRLAFDTPPMPPGSQRVRVLDLAGNACSQVGRMLMNGLLLCETEAGPRDDCGTVLTTSSRTEAPLDY